MLFRQLDALEETPVAVSSGSAVKGQAAVLKADIDPALPVIFLDGLYIVPHDNGLVAIGSTSEDRFDDPLANDHLLDDLLARARAVVPSLCRCPRGRALGRLAANRRLAAIR